MPSANIHVQGLIETQAKLKQVSEDLVGSEMYKVMLRAASLVSRDAKLNAPVDRGLLRASITPDVRSDGKTVYGVVGSNVSYAPFMETGTGTPAGHAPHYPPPDALNVWAGRHGFSSGYAVARAIWRRGGLVGRHYLQKGFEANQNEIRRMIENGVQGTVDK